MNSSEEQLEELARKIEQRQLITRRWVWLTTMIPIIFAVVFLVYTLWQINIAVQKRNQAVTALEQATLELATVEAKIPAAQATVTAAEATQVQLQVGLSQAQVALATSTAELANVQAALATSNADMLTARGFTPYACSISPERLKEHAYGTRQADVLNYLFSLQQKNVAWNPHGFSIADGFDSPNFALFVLQNATEPPLVSPDIQRDTLPWNIITLPSTTSPKDGDIIYYESGYTMFYYNIGVDPDPNTMQYYIPCVIGMTPLGIQVLKVDFATQRGALQVFP